MAEYAEIPAAYVERLRAICLALPETHEEKAWTGTRWRIRTRTFAHAISVDNADIVVFRSEPPELDVLREAGHPYFYAGWGRDVVGIVLETNTNWDEVKELLTDSYCVMAPKKLRAQVEAALNEA